MDSGQWVLGHRMNSFLILFNDWQAIGMDFFSSFLLPFLGENFLLIMYILQLRVNVEFSPRLHYFFDTWKFAIKYLKFKNSNVHLSSFLSLFSISPKNKIKLEHNANEPPSGKNFTNWPQTPDLRFESMYSPLMKKIETWLILIYDISSK